MQLNLRLLHIDLTHRIYFAIMPHFLVYPFDLYAAECIKYGHVICLFGFF